ncbi:MAG: ribonuclease P protein component [Pseudomonadota bacterium]
MALPASLTKRRDFLACARGRKHAAPGVLMQGLRRPAPPEGAAPVAPPLRVGYTASKKVGNAVIRNRAKRRLREAAARVLPRAGRPGWDYVLVARAGGTVERRFEALVDDIAEALERIHAPRKPKRQ